MSKKLTITDILKDKEKYQLKQDVKVDLYIKRLDAAITVRKPERSLCIEAVGMSQDPNLADKADTYLTYNIVVEPNLKDPELQKAFGCAEPSDIVDKLFEAGEIPSIAQKGMELAGYMDSVSQVEDIKN